MPSLISHLSVLLFFTSSVAFASDEVVEVPSYGAVPLSDARATCANGVGIGALAEPGAGDRVAAIVQWGENELASSDHDESSWPRHQADLSYARMEIPWVPRGVVTSCWAVGHRDVAKGLELRRLCDTDRSACKEAFAEEERERVKDAMKGKVKGRKDAMFQALAALPDLQSWHPPLESLERACSWPLQAATGGRFVDMDDLQAARSACTQLVELITGDSAADLATLPCAGPWSTPPEGMLRSPDSDLGVIGMVEVASSTEVQHATLRDKLSRMNTASASCDPASVPAEQQAIASVVGAMWSESLVAVYREAQMVQACQDDALVLEERLDMCPTLVEGADTSCRRGDHEACQVLGQLHLDGVGVDANEAAAFEVWQVSCNASHTPACEALAGHRHRIQSWLDEALVAAAAIPGEDPGDEDPFTSASGIVARFGTALGSEWVGASAARLFDAAIQSEREKGASDVITMYGTTLGETWKAEANTRLAEMQTLLKKRSEP